MSKSDKSGDAAVKPTDATDAKTSPDMANKPPMQLTIQTSRTDNEEPDLDVKSKAEAVAKLKEIATMIDDNNGPHTGDLIKRLERQFGAKFRDTSEGRTYVNMGDIEAGARGNKSQALANWANKARRLILQVS
ncbi:MAG: hypothetical protein ACPG61_14765 [Paracoccaceae bacterium]